MKNIKLLTAIATCLLVASMFAVIPAFSAQPPIVQSTYYVGTVGQPRNLDPMTAYDTASGEIIQNVYQPLIWYGSRKPIDFTPGVGYNVTASDLSDLSVFEPVIATQVPTDTNGGIIRYANGSELWTFTINSNAQFPSWTAANGTVMPTHNVTVDDVIYSFQRQMIYDSSNAPTWMWYATAFNTSWSTWDDAFGASASYANGTFVSSTYENEAAALIQSWVFPSGGNNVSFFFQHPYADTAMYQIFAQTWGSILEKAWVIEHGGWNGSFTMGWSNNYRRKPSNTYSEVDLYKDPAIYGVSAGSKYSAGSTDVPDMLGTGPYLFTSWNMATSTWRIDYNPNYWLGWGSAGDGAGNYIKTVIEVGVASWPTMKMLFLNGVFDAAPVSVANMYSLLVGTSYNPIPGISMAYNIPLLRSDEFFFCMNINATSPYQCYVGYPGNTTAADPTFFADQNIRTAFAWAFNYTDYFANAWSGEAIQHATWWTTGLTPFNGNDSFLNPQLRNLNLANMKYYLDQAAPIGGRNVSQDGFNVTFLYNTGSAQRMIACQELANAWNNLGSKYHVNVVGVSWPTFSTLVATNGMPGYSSNWLADFADAADFCGAYMSSSGYLSSYQGPPWPADQATIDAEVTQAANDINPTARAAKYQDLELRYWNDCISIALDQPTGRIWARDWVQGQWINQLMPGLYAYNLYKAVAAREDWPMFHHDLTHTGNSTSTAPNGVLTWYYMTGNWVTSSPAVVGGVVYVGSGDNNVYALNAITGAQIWNYTTGGPINWASPAVAYGYVYVDSNDGNVYALDAATGTQVWNFSTGSPVYSSPAVADGVVYVGSTNGYVYALNAVMGSQEWGTQVWNFSTGSAVWSSPAIVSGVVYVGSDNGNVYALNATTGAPMWSFSTGSAVRSSPAVVGGVIYVGSDNGNVYALNNATHQPVRIYPTGSAVWSSPAVAGGVVYVGSDNGNVYAWNTATGAKMWSYATGGAVQSSPAVAGGVVYVGSNDGNLYALNSTTGTQVWSFQTGGGFSSPAVVGGVVYVGSAYGVICALSNQVDVYRYHPTRTEPAPMGIADYGIGPSGPYEYNTTSFVGIVTVASLLTLISGSSNYDAGFQLNVNLEINTSSGPLVFWIQNVAAVTTFGSYLRFDNIIDSVWNQTNPSAIIDPSGILGNGSFGRAQDPYGYVGTRNSNGTFHPSILYTPATITLNVTSWVNPSGQPMVSFAYDIGHGLITYDTVTFKNVIGFKSLTGFEVNGFNYNPAGFFYDSELILGGPGNGTSTTDVSSDVQLQLEYWNGNNYQMVPNAYNFGSNTGEGINNTLSQFYYYTGNETIYAKILPGAGTLGKLYDQSQTVTIDIISPLASGTLYVTDPPDPNATAWQIPFVGGRVTVTLYPGKYNLQLYTQDGQLFSQGNFTISAGQTVYLQTPLSSWRAIPGDIDGDGIVSIYDAIILSGAFGSTPGNRNWNPNADINGDGIVDIYDAIIFSNHFGQHIP